MSKQVLQEVAADKIPEWLNDAFFVDIMRKEYNLDAKDDCKVKIVSIKPAVRVGENYVAGLFRVVVQADEKKHSFILKFANGSTDGIVEFPAFDKETEMYRDVIPAFETEYARIGEDVNFGPKFHYATKSPVDIIVFDDLNANGYFVPDRLQGIDLDHSKFLVEKLAKFHAASAVYHEKHGDYKDSFKSLYTDNGMEQMMSAWIASSFKYFVEVIRENKLLRHLADKIEKWDKIAFKELQRATTPHPDKFNVMNHGDLWVNNYLFKYDENEQPADILFIDYQVSYYGSPVNDLYYLFVSSTQHDIKERQFDYVINCYFTELVTNLKKLGYKKKLPTLKELHVDLLNGGFMGAFCCYGIMSVVLLDPREDANMKIMMDESEKGVSFRKAIYRTPRYIRGLEKMLPLLDRRGLLDY